MTEAQIYAALNEIFQDLFGDEDLVVGPTTRAADVPGWDSFAHVNLVTTAEQRFGVKFTTSEIESFKNVGDLVKRIQHRLGK